MINKIKGWETYWFPIVAGLTAVTLLFLNHLFTGQTPNRVAITIPGLNFDIYWYGIAIVGGIALGCYVVATHVQQRALAVFNPLVPASLQAQTLATLNLPQDVTDVLTKLKITTVGRLLLQWGFNPQTLGLNRAGLAAVRQKLESLPDMQADWLTDAPWRIWNPDHVWNGIGICLVLGVIGARLYHVLTPSPSMAAVGITTPWDYFQHPYQLINLRNGGLGIYGGIVGGAIGLIWYTYRHSLPFLEWADLAAIGLALGQVFGRWGNFFNQELYGRPSNLPWAITIDPAYRLPAYSEFSRFHPAFLYESLWSLLAFFVLLTLYRRYGPPSEMQRLLPGDLMALYLIFYAIGRTLLETVRLDSRTLNLAGLSLSLSIATFVSLILAVCMALWLFVRHNKK